MSTRKVRDGKQAKPSTQTLHTTTSLSSGELTPGASPDDDFVNRPLFQTIQPQHSHPSTPSQTLLHQEDDLYPPLSSHEDIGTRSGHSSYNSTPRHQHDDNKDPTFFDYEAKEDIVYTPSPSPLKSYSGHPEIAMTHPSKLPQIGSPRDSYDSPNERSPFLASSAHMNYVPHAAHVHDPIDDPAPSSSFGLRVQRGLLAFLHRIQSPFRVFRSPHLQQRALLAVIIAMLFATLILVAYHFIFTHHYRRMTPSIPIPPTLQSSLPPHVLNHYRNVQNPYGLLEMQTLFPYQDVLPPTFNTVYPALPKAVSSPLDSKTHGQEYVTTVNSLRQFLTDNNLMCSGTPDCLHSFNRFTFDLLCPASSSGMCNAMLEGYDSTLTAPLVIGNVVIPDNSDLHETMDVLPYVLSDHSHRLPVTFNINVPRPYGVLSTPHHVPRSLLQPTTTVGPQLTVSASSIVPSPRLGAERGTSNDAALTPIAFPPGFMFGAATAAYQIEGAYLHDSKTLNIWDVFSHIPGKIANDDNGDIANDSYHLFEEDLRLLRFLGVKSYRFSISWSRIITRQGDVNPHGIKYYSNIIDKLLEYDIIPMITLFHWDTPIQFTHLNDTMQAHWQSIQRKRSGNHPKHGSHANDASETNLFINLGHTAENASPHQKQGGGDAQHRRFQPIHTVDHDLYSEYMGRYENSTLPQRPPYDPHWITKTADEEDIAIGGGHLNIDEFLAHYDEEELKKHQKNAKTGDATHITSPDRDKVNPELPVIHDFIRLYKHLNESQVNNVHPRHKMNGFLNENIVDEFVKYADVVFSNFGGRVKYFSTFNEPLTYCLRGHYDGTFAPGRCSDRARCPYGNSATEPYLCSHYILLSHLEAVKLFNNKYRKKYPHTQLTMVLNSDFFFPRSAPIHSINYRDEHKRRELSDLYTPGKNSHPTIPEDEVKAQTRALLFNLGWYADVLYKGDYPSEMKDSVGKRLPRFTKKQKADFLANPPHAFNINYYSSRYVTLAENCQESHPYQTDFDQHGFSRDMCVNIHEDDFNGHPIGPRADSPWLRVVPRGFSALLKWIHDRYNPKSIVVMENGTDVPGHSERHKPIEYYLNDPFRVSYYQSHLSEMVIAMKQFKLPITGYMAWSLEDNFEWNNGYDKKFGITYIDRTTLRRYPKMSFYWYRELIVQNSSPREYDEESSRDDD